MESITIEERLMDRDVSLINQIPQIPWLAKYGKIAHLPQSNIAKLIQDVDKLRLFATLSEAIPIFLPKNYHQMTCASLKKNMPHEIETHWETVFRFIQCCSVFDNSRMAYLFGVATKCVDKYLTEEQLPYIIKTLWSQKKSELEHCPTAAEFLLEPWILIQMPFQHAMLNQWAVALLAETLTFQKKISPVFCYGVPAKLTKAANNLRQMLLAMKSCANFMLKLYVKICREGQKKNFHLVLQPEFEEFSNHLMKVLPILEFVTSEEANSIIGAMVNMCLDELNAGGNVQPSQVVILDLEEEPTPLYDFWFWTRVCNLMEVFTGAKGDRGQSNSELLPRNVQIVMQEDEQMDLLMEIVSKKIIGTGRLKGVDNEIIMETVKENADFLYVYVVHILQHKDTCSDGMLMEEGGFGVISNIISVYSDVRVNEIVDLLTRHIFDEVKKMHPHKIKICNPAQEVQTEHLISEIELSFDKILNNQHWTWDKILADVESMCDSSHIPSDGKLRSKKVAEQYQYRIRNLVRKIAQRHLTTLKAGRFEYVPELQFVQYVLPCFVLFFLSHCKDKSQSPAKINEFMVLVNRLITGYEQKEYVQLLATEPKDSMQNLREPADFFLLFTQTNFLVYHYGCDYFRKLVTDFNFAHALERYTSASLTQFHCHKNWYVQSSMFINRVSSVMYIGEKKPPSNTSVHDMCCAIIQSKDQESKAIDSLSKYYQIEQSGPKNFSETVMKYRLSKQQILNNVPRDMLKAAELLTSAQLAGLFAFVHFNNNINQQHFMEWKDQFQGPGFPLDLKSVFMWSLATGDKWKIRQLLSTLLMDGIQRKKRSENPYLVSLNVLKSNRCYKSVLKMISADGTKVLMKEPGEITFVPVKHCRWCGLIQVEKFRMCPECFVCPEYCDLHYFCSEKCETEALDSKHREEHARYYEVKLAMCL